MLIFAISELLRHPTIKFARALSVLGAPEGTYLVKGALRMSDGKSEETSLILGVR